MKSYVVGLVLALSLGLVFAAPAQSEQDNKEEQAVKECNATNPIQRHVGLLIAAGIASGDRIKLSQEEKCFLLCFLQKVKFLNENGDINNGPGLVNYTLRNVPELAKYSEMVIATIFQINRSTKGFTDKCQKAFVIYHQYSQSLFVLAVAQGLQEQTGVKDQIVNSIDNGQPVDQHISQKVKKFLEYFNALVTSFGKDIEKQLQSQQQSGIAK